MNAIAGRLSTLTFATAAAIVMVTLAIPPFLTPQWIALEQGRANAAAWTGYSTEELRTATDAIVADLVFGPPAFDVEVRGEPVLAERERDHMRDVRAVFVGLWAVAAVSLVVLVAGYVRVDRARFWKAVRRGALALAGTVVVLGVVAVFAFDALFELFHRIVFPAGSYAFDPSTERLVQLFPSAFWQEMAIAVGLVIVAIGLLTAAFAGRLAVGRASRSVQVELATTPSR